MFNHSLLAQSKPPTVAASSLCNRENASEIIRQQIAVTKTFDNTVQRITVLIRAADLLWSYQQNNARAAFTEAFDLAARNFNEKDDQPKTEGRGLLVEIPDQRYVVVRAVAKRDPAWAKKLTEEMLAHDRQETAEAATNDTQRDIRTAEKLLDSATSLLSSDVTAASSFARASLSYPASIRLTAFLYKLAEVNQKAADQFYEQALAVYGGKPMREFLYLAAYPFGGLDAGDMPVFGAYRVPTNFVPNGSLQRSFVRLLLLRAQQALETPLDEGDNFNGISGAGHLWQALARLEPQVQKLLPDLSGALEQARWNIFASLSQETQRIFSRPERNQQNSSPTKTFDEQIEVAEAEPNVNRRDELIVSAILRARDTESIDNVSRSADKINDSDVRRQLRDWLYFSRALSAIKNKRFDEARKLASKVVELDQRAYLYSEIAKESLDKTEDQTLTRETLEEIVATAGKAPDTIVKARTLLAAAYLYTKLDLSRSMSVLGDAINCINHIEAPDFSRQSVIRKIEGRNFARYAAFQASGFEPENTFREMGKIAFDDALSLAGAFTDKPLRALTMLALADICLQRAQQQEKGDKPRKK
jgi:hypothetical protein